MLVTNTAVAVRSGTSIKYHAVPSLAIAQSRGLDGARVIGKNRLTTDAVFGVAVWLRNVTVLLELIDHAPVNVAMRTSLRRGLSRTGPNVSGFAGGGVPSTARTTFAIRPALAMSNCVRDMA